MKSRLLRAFIALADLGSYHLAANALCVTQPALTKQIQALELQLGLRIFERGRQGATLTAGGQRLYSQALALVRQHDAFCQHAGRVAKGAAGYLALGFGMSSFHLAPRVIMAFRQHFPDVSVNLNDLPSQEQCRLLISGELHAGFVRLPVDAALHSRVLLTERLVLAVPSVLQLQSGPANKAIEKFPLLQLNPQRGRGLSEQAYRFMNACNLTPTVAQQTDDIHTLLALVAAGVGVAILPQSVLYIAPAGVDIQPLDGEHTHWQVGIAWNPALADPLRDNFLNLAVEIAEGERAPLAIKEPVK